MIIAAGPFTTTDNLFFEPLVEFSGEIPNSLGGLKNLNYLRLNNNSLTGPCPQSLSNIEGLTLVDLSYNNLSGSLPRIPARTLNLVLQTNQELDHDEKLSFRHQMGPPVANSPPGSQETTSVDLKDRKRHLHFPFTHFSSVDGVELYQHCTLILKI
ncbi:uncharacterized protein [Arachis hypogaea]|uniref:uncharacterized protein isoform X1 n=1 Tax=Arachis hypogaea TaxID=3818 RepID=UPI000A2C3E77|nr:somatic embryogenesis receptor kinase 2 isoform X1 [Arachis hypogaea]XP_025605959.1 somatic embryogenesis receptor kinase 2 isoform X1 [Arachis hypogaea]